MTKLEAIKTRLAAVKTAPWSIGNHTPQIVDKSGVNVCWMDYDKGAIGERDLVAHAPADIAALLRVAIAAERCNDHNPWCACALCKAIGYLEQEEL